MPKQISITRSSMPPFEEYVEEIHKHKQLEKTLSQYLDVPFVNLFANVHLAPKYMIEAFDLKGEVITAPFIFASTTHAIVRKGLTPVFCDIDLCTYTMDAEKI